MPNGEQKMLLRGVAAGILIGMAIGLTIALFIVMKPHGHNWAAVSSVGIATFTAVAISFWVAIRSQTGRDDEIKGPKRR